MEDSRSPAHCLVAVSVNAPHLVLVVRFPIPDLRSDQERGPWFKKSLQKEVLRLELEDLELKTELSGNSSPEQTKIELIFKELSGKKLFQFNPFTPKMVFKHSHVSKEKRDFICMTLIYAHKSRSRFAVSVCKGKCLIYKLL